MVICGDRTYDGQHPLVRIHEGNGRPALFSTLGYVQGVVDMEDGEARSLLRDIHEHEIDDAVIYRHRWEPDMAVVWDNRSVLHRTAVTKATTAFATNDDRLLIGRQRASCWGSPAPAPESLPEDSHQASPHATSTTANERRAEGGAYRHRRCRQPGTAVGRPEQSEAQAQPL